MPPTYMMRTKLLLLFILILLYEATSQELYTERFRPQFHPSPRTGFMGDPNGPIKFAGKYHLFWWGHMVSDDLVHWEELTGSALKGTPSGFGNWSGSVVMDISNTAGFNTASDTAMIAVYTLNENSSGIQSQAISVSLNHGSFDYYQGNPVIPSTQKDFRDPQVFWHEETEKWVMVVTKPIDRAIEFYTSPDLKAWTYTSKFQGHGARKEVWEVPDLFELSINNNPNTKKWVLSCGMGPNRMQYWVGDFDGERFTLDPQDNLVTGTHFPGVVFQDFESGYGTWTVEGSAFGDSPSSGAIANQQEVMGYSGAHLANSFTNGDASTGKLTSPTFKIEERFINFLIGGGAGSDLGLSVIVEGQEIISIVSTSNTEVMQWRGVDLSSYMGRMAHIEVVDNATGGWGHLLVDHIVFSDFEFDTRVENANWADWGYDFYAGKTYRNYDYDDPRTIWIAWMGNWTYARDVPTNPWKGCESIPRENSLKHDANGFRLVQKPVEELQSLRLPKVQKDVFEVSGVQPLVEFHPEWNVYELYVEFKVTRDNQVFGLNLAEGEDRKIEIRYDSHTSVLSINRAKTPFSFAYKRVTETPVFLKADSVLDLHIFLDQSSIEVFANDYETSTTSLAFTDVTATGISLFSESETTEVLNLSVWELKSIWGVTAEDVERPPVDPVDPLAIDRDFLAFFPNPVRRGEALYIAESDGVEVSIFDISGNRHFYSSSAKSIQIPDHLTPGVYILTLNGAEGLVTQKILIQ